MIRISLNRKTSYLDLLFIFICLWTITSIGSQVQFYIFKFISSDSSNLYGSAFEEAITKMPTLNAYISSSYSLTNNFNYIPVLLVIISSLFFRSSVQIFLSCILSSILSLTVTDAIVLYTSDALTAKSMVECIIANAIGSSVIAMFLVFLYYIKYSLLRLNSINLPLRHVISYICYALTCLIMLTISYYVICLFYRPTNVNFSVSTSENLSGNYFLTSKINSSDNIKENKNREKFSILENPFEIKNELQVFGKIDEIKSNLKENQSYNLAITLLFNCIDSYHIKKPLSKSIQYDNVRSFSIKPSESMSIIRFDDKSGHAMSNDELVNMFSAERNEKGTYTLNKITDGKTIYFPSNSGAGFYIATPVIEYPKNYNKKIIKFTLSINGIDKEINIEAERLRTKNIDQQLKCEIVNMNNISPSVNIKENDAVLAGLLVKLEPSDIDEYYNPTIDSEGNNIEIKGGLIYNTIESVTKEELFKRYISNGYADGFILHSFDKLSLDGKNIESNKMDNIMFIGDDLYAYTSTDNNLVISGNAYLFYKNSLRQNKTLWEYSNDNTLIFSGIGVILLSILVWSLNKFISMLRRDEVINVL
ncbi:hypothetical protein F3J42_12780 [Pantoea sp. Ap-959]|uniref:hypothetical protein n=1 Tax=unclassified Pantoea TaxID=2630326 RepID=UPI0011B0E1BD|nr:MULTISPECIES: hypothetical protein [unclassified Pantoea]NIG34764.1 hypothetical protein [Pantoea sp. Ap-959]